MSVLGGIADVVGSTVSSGLNMLANKKAADHQKELLRAQSDEYFRNARLSGATPAAVAAGITGSLPTVPGASTGGNPASDLGSSFSRGISAASTAALNRSQIALNESEKDINAMKLEFEPKKYFADVEKAMSEAFKNYASGHLDKEMQNYYSELTQSVKEKRPWEIAQLKQGVDNLIAEYEKIKSETSRNKSQSNMFEKEAGLAVANTEKSYSESYRAQMEAFALQFENFLRAENYNPNKSPWDNVLRWLFTDPEKFDGFMNSFGAALGSLDQKLKFSLGEHYKRNAMLAGGLHYYLKNVFPVSSKNHNERMRFIGSLAPMLMNPAAGAASLSFQNPYVYSNY